MAIMRLRNLKCPMNVGYAVDDPLFCGSADRRSFHKIVRPHRLIRSRMISRTSTMNAEILRPGFSNDRNKKECSSFLASF